MKPAPEHSGNDDIILCSYATRSAFRKVDKIGEEIEVQSGIGGGSDEERCRMVYKARSKEKWSRNEPPLDHTYRSIYYTV